MRCNVIYSLYEVLFFDILHTSACRPVSLVGHKLTFHEPNDEREWHLYEKIIAKLNLGV